MKNLDEQRKDMDAALPDDGNAALVLAAGYIGDCLRHLSDVVEREHAADRRMFAEQNEQNREDARRARRGRLVAPAKGKG